MEARSAGFHMRIKSEPVRRIPGTLFYMDTREVRGSNPPVDYRFDRPLRIPRPVRRIVPIPTDAVHGSAESEFCATPKREDPPTPVYHKGPTVTN